MGVAVQTSEDYKMHGCHVGIRQSDAEITCFSTKTYSFRNTSKKCNKIAKVSLLHIEVNFSTDLRAP